jgi:hypothetical protein
MSLLQLQEFIDINEDLDLVLESEQTQFTDEQLEKAEYFELKWNPVSGGTKLHIYDEAGEPLGSVEYPDEDVAIEMALELFDFEEDDLYDMESYAWANDDIQGTREWEALQDDGTSGE